MDPVSIVCMVVFIVQYLLRIFTSGDSVLRDLCSPHHFVSIGDCSFICFAVVLRLSFCDCNLLVLCLAIVIRLAFCDDDLCVFCLAILGGFSLCFAILIQSSFVMQW